MRYVSTRGEAPSLGFIETTLTGLARDGGLYVPEAWPRLEPAAIAGFAGRPYAEVAGEVIRAVRGGCVPEPDLARMAREAYGGFRHPAVAPLVQLGAGDFMLELFHGPTLAFKDLAMQLLGRLMDHALAARGERATSRSRPRAIPAARRSRRFAAAAAPTCSSCFRTAASPTCSGG